VPGALSVSVLPRRTTPALLQIGAILQHLNGKDALQEVCRYLHAEFAHYAWVGIYALDGETLKLSGWDGPEATEHTEIPVGQGICGRAAREKATVLVEDVRAAPEYLACFLTTRAEVVVPVMDGDRVLGEIDVDGNQVKAFDASDARFLGEVAKKIVAPLRDALTPPSAAAPSLTALPLVRRPP
jgi:L-methionine (R)-S-oxide reductase